MENLKMIKQQCFSSLKTQKRQFFNFLKTLWIWYKMETQKIINLLNDYSKEQSKLATKKWYVIDNPKAKGKYKQGDTIRFETEIIKSSLSDYSDAYILVTDDVTVAAGNGKDAVFKTVYHFLNVKQKLLMCLSTKQIIFTLQCLCTTWSNMMIII